MAKTLLISIILAVLSLSAAAGYPLPIGSPQLTFQSQSGPVTIALIVYHQENIAGDDLQVQTVQLVNGEWLLMQPYGQIFYQTLGGNAGLLADEQNAGGEMSFYDNLDKKINTFLTTIVVCAASGCGSTPPISTSCTNGAMCESNLYSHVASKQLKVVNGVITWAP